MNNFNKIQNLDLKDAVRRTHLEYDFLEALVNKDFVTLQRFNVKGFLKILSKEYDIDFSEFMEEFDAYMQENNPKDNLHKTVIVPKLDGYASSNSGLWQWFIALVVIGVIGGGVYYYDVISLISNKAGIVLNSDENETLQSEVLIVDNQAQVAENLDDNVSENSNLPLINEEEVLEDEGEVDLENNVSSVAKLQNENSKENMQENIENSEPVKAKLSEAKFSTAGKIWVGYIDIKTLKKTSLVKNKNFSVPLNGDDRLMVVGTHAITMVDEMGNEFNFPAGKLKRFIIQNGTIKNITLAEFVKYNKGKGW